MTITRRLYQMMAKIRPIMYLYGHLYWHDEPNFGTSCTLQGTVFDLDTSSLCIWCMTITRRLYQMMAEIRPIMYVCRNFLHIMRPIFALFWYFWGTPDLSFWARMFFSGYIMHKYNTYKLLSVGQNSIHNVPVLSRLLTQWARIWHILCSQC